MKKLFNAAFLIFIAAGTISFAAIILGVTNEALLRWYGPVINFPPIFGKIFLNLLACTGFATLATGPTFLFNIIITCFKEDWGNRKNRIALMAIGIFFSLLIISIIAAELMYQPVDYKRVEIISTVVVVSIVLAFKGDMEDAGLQDFLDFFKKIKFSLKKNFA